MSLSSVVRADDLFGSLGKEEFRKMRKPVVSCNEAVKRFFEIFKEVLVDTEFYEYSYEGKYLAFEKYKFDAYSAKDITEFSVIMGYVQEYRNFSLLSGLCLSWLINESSEKDFLLHTAHLSFIPNYVGFYNTKNVEIRGNVGDFVCNKMKRGRVNICGDAGIYLGDEMRGGRLEVTGDVNSFVGCESKSGQIVVEGNAKDSVGYGLSGGNVLVKGNVDKLLGHNMSKGIVEVRGNAGSLVGLRMSGGKIKVKGDIQSIGNEIFNGSILHKRKYLVKDGRKVV